MKYVKTPNLVVTPGRLAVVVVTGCGWGGGISVSVAPGSPPVVIPMAPPMPMGQALVGGGVREVIGGRHPAEVGGGGLMGMCVDTGGPICCKRNEECYSVIVNTQPTCTYFQRHKWPQI